MDRIGFDALNAMIDLQDCGIVLLDHLNNVVIWNQFMEKNSGVRAGEIIGTCIFSAFPYLPRAWLELKLQSVKMIKSYSFISWTQTPYLFKFRRNRSILEDREGIEYMHQDCTFIPIFNQQDGETYVCITIRDVTELVMARRKIEEMEDMAKTLAAIASYDSLTSVFNRGYIEKQLEGEFNRAKRYQTPFCLLMFDIDHFKRVNDRYGHMAGDEVLRKVCQAVTRQIRQSDIFGRYGGEEFMIILQNLSDEAATVVSEKLRKLIEGLTVRHEEAEIKITASMGFVEYRSDMLDHLQMIHEADMALYHSKKSGRNRSSLYRPASIVVTDH